LPRAVKTTVTEMTMITFPNESAEYRTARETLLQKEIELRRAMEDVAVARRALPPGGLVPEDYVFDGLDADGKPARIKLSELFSPGKDTLIVYSMMFPRHPQETRDVATSGGTAKLARADQPCPSCTALLASSTAPSAISRPPASISRLWAIPRLKT